MSRCPHDLPLDACTDCMPRTPPRILQGSLKPPLAADYGPWFIAAYNGSCRGCGDNIQCGDEIRADGTGGYLGRCCGGDDESVHVIRDARLVSWGLDPAHPGYRNLTQPPTRRSS